MSSATTILENELLQKVRLLSEEKQQEVLDFTSFLLAKIRKERLSIEQATADSKTESVVEETWGNLALDRETLMYIAEDKDLEYDM